MTLEADIEGHPVGRELSRLASALGVEPAEITTYVERARPRSRSVDPTGGFRGQLRNFGGDKKRNKVRFAQYKERRQAPLEEVG